MGKAHHTIPDKDAHIPETAHMVHCSKVDHKFHGKAVCKHDVCMPMHMAPCTEHMDIHIFSCNSCVGSFSGKAKHKEGIPYGKGTNRDDHMVALCCTAADMEHVHSLACKFHRCLGKCAGNQEEFDGRAADTDKSRG